MMVSSCGPLKGLVFIYLCDLKWPCTVGRDVAPDSAQSPWEHRLKAGVGFPLVLAPRCHKGGGL